MTSQSLMNYEIKKSWHYFLHTSAKQSMSSPPTSKIAIAPPMGINYEPKALGWRGWGVMGTAGIDSYIKRIKSLKHVFFYFRPSSPIS